MARIKHRLKGSTLTEMLVMMLVAGIVFLSVMDGLRLFTQLQIRRAEELTEAGREAAGYYRTESLIAAADSIRPGPEGLVLYCGEDSRGLQLRDSALLYFAGEFSDTLLRRVVGLRLSGDDRGADTVEVCLRGFTAKFTVVEPAVRQHRRSLEKIEDGYAYEE